MNAAFFAPLATRPFPRTLAHSSHGVLMRQAVAHLELDLTSDYHEKTLLLVEPQAEPFLLIIERLLRYTGCQHILLLPASPRKRAQMLHLWDHELVWEEDRRIAEVFSMTTDLHPHAAAQVCLSTVVDIQTQVGLDATRPLFSAFDVLLVEVPTFPGPAWHRIIDLYVASHTPVLGLSSTLSHEAGEALWGHVIDARPTQTPSL